MNSEIGLLINKLCRTGDADELSRTLQRAANDSGLASINPDEKSPSPHDSSQLSGGTSFFTNNPLGNVIRRDYLIACKHGHGRCVKVILDFLLSLCNDFAIELIEFKDSKTGKSGLHLAAMSGSLEVLFTIISCFHKITMRCESQSHCDTNSETSSKRMKLSSIYEALDVAGYTPVETAVLANRSEAVQLLLRYSISALDKDKLLTNEPNLSRKSPQGFAIIENLMPEWSDYRIGNNAFIIIDDECTPLHGAKNRTIRSATLYCYDIYSNNDLRKSLSGNGVGVCRVVVKCSKSIQDTLKELEFHATVVNEDDGNFAKLVISDVLRIGFAYNRVSVSRFPSGIENISLNDNIWYGLILERGEIDIHKACVSISQGVHVNSEMIKAIKNCKPSILTSISGMETDGWRLYIAEALMRIVSSLHERKLCWMDIKLSNLIAFITINEEVVIKAIDLGGCLKMDSKVKFENISFSMKFAAPELIVVAAAASENNADGSFEFIVSEKADLWSLGMCILQLYDRNCKVFYLKELKLNHSADIMTYFATNSEVTIQESIDNYIANAKKSNPSRLLDVAKLFLHVDPMKRNSIKSAIESIADLVS